MTGEEQNIISALVALKQNAGIIGGIAAVVLAVLGWLGRNVFASIGKRIEEAMDKATKADDQRRDDVTAIHGKIDGHIQRDIETHQAILAAINKNTEKLGDIHVALTKDLANRPTRDELRDFIVLQQGAKP